MEFSLQKQRFYRCAPRNEVRNTLTGEKYVVRHAPSHSMSALGSNSSLPETPAVTSTGPFGSR